MRIIRWQPFQEMDLLMQLWDAQSENSLDTASPFTQSLTDITLEQTPESIILTACLPGLNPEQVTINATPKTVTLSGEQCYKSASRGRCQLSYKRFQRTIPLPVPIQDEHIMIETRQGTLRLTLPKLSADSSSPGESLRVSQAQVPQRYGRVTAQQSPRQEVQWRQPDRWAFREGMGWNSFRMSENMQLSMARFKRWLGYHLKAIADKLLE